jgi:hypothetical protein
MNVPERLLARKKMLVNKANILKDLNCTIYYLKYEQFNRKDTEEYLILSCI